MESNAALQQILGYSADDLRQMRRLDFYHSRENKEEQIQFERLLRGDTQHYQVEQRFARKDGRLIWGRMTVSLIRSTAGSPSFLVSMIEDITERLRAEEAHLRYASIVEYSNDAIISKTFDGVIFNWNPAAERVFGYSAQEANGRSIQLIIPPDLEAEHQEIVTKIKRGERMECFETMRLRKDGSLIHVALTASPILDVSGRIVAVSTISRDISGRKRAEKLSDAFSKLGERLSSATNAVSAARTISKVADSLFGWDACCFDLCSADQKKFTPILTVDLINGKKTELNQEMKECEASNMTRSVVENGARLVLRQPPYEFSKDLKKFGNPNLISSSMMFVPVRNGPESVGVLTIQSYSPNAYTQEDLETLQALADHAGGALERIRAESENQKLAAFVQYNPNPVLELTWEGTVNYWNDAAQRMADSLGLRDAGMVLPSDTHAIVKECLGSGETKVRIETVIKNRTISWSFYPIQAIGVVHCYAADVTERQSLESQLRQSQKMDSVGQLAGGIAHDFNNILTVIQGHLSLLSMESGLSPAAQDSAQQIHSASERAANLTRQLLTFSRRQVIQPRNLDLNEVVMNMTKMLNRLLGEDISLQVSCLTNLPRIHADPNMMDQILLNLAVNSRDAMPKGGNLLVNTSIERVDETYKLAVPEAIPGNYVCLTVKDTGCGIPPEILPKIFEPFFTTKDVGKGTGLGLATVYGIVQQHNGWIKVHSIPNRETVFQIYFPIVREVVAPAPETSKTPSQVKGGNETILVVEDEPPLRMLVRAVLERYGYNVLEAVSGPSALEIWAEKKDSVDMLLTDMKMPQGMSGKELAERILLDKPDLKVIFCSGYSLDMIGDGIVLKEGLNFLQKPYHPSKLARTVRECLDALN